MKDTTRIKKYEKLLEKAPYHDSPDFLEFVKENTIKAGLRIIEDNEEWLIVENIKYHRPDRPWVTAFLKKHPKWYWDCQDTLWTLVRVNGWESWEWVKRADCRHKVDRVFFHFYLPEEKVCPLE